ncbi:trophoblast glycoprotein-like [Acanthaster planci]|uniref:Trophoblast glycoprotein-like n=1 Tax=Acanthaster planci TaxID=133434 RepID=A0A8B7ZPH9_ACAPL|nr:trophoblast glycoprotein-like [Acanthaster planci]
MARSEQHLSLLIVLVLSMTAIAVQGSRCQLRTRPDSCLCSGTALTCSAWPVWKMVSENTTSLTVSGVTTLEDLSMAYQPSRALTKLTTLILTNDNISNIEEGWFSGTIFPALEEVILDQNKLTPNATQKMFAQVSEELRLLSLRAAFLNISSPVQNLKHVFSDVKGTKLEALRLDSNNIGLLPSFPKGSKFLALRNLTLHNSDLIGIQNGTFQKRIFPNLQNLDLSNNKLVNVDKLVIDNDFNSFASEQPSLSIRLGGNPFFCNCKLKAFQAWLNTTNLVADRDNVTCGDAVETSRRGQPVLGSQLPCRPGPDEVDVENELRPSYIILSVILALVGLLALIVLYLRRNDIKDYFVGVYTTTKEAFTSRHGYDDINRVRRDTPEMTPTEV